MQTIVQFLHFTTGPRPDQTLVDRLELHKVEPTDGPPRGGAELENLENLEDPD